MRLLLVALLCCPLVALGGKVLVFPMDGSAWVNLRILLEELHSRGHDITVVRPANAWYIKAQSSFYKSITINASAGYSQDDGGAFFSNMIQQRREGLSVWAQINYQYEMLLTLNEINKIQAKMSEQVFENETVMQDLKDARYDMMLADPLMPVGVLLAHRLELPLVLSGRWTLHGESHFQFAPNPLSYVPHPLAKLTDKMSFMERVKNVLFYLYELFQVWFVVDPVFQPLVLKYFGPDMQYRQMFQAADIWLMRNDFTFEFPRPTMPNVVYVSCFQCKEPRPLTSELEQFMQSSGEHGVIVMTLGTMAQMPEDIAEEIAAAFAQIPHKVIWRHTGKQPSTLGNNTLLVDWLPQNDLLGHPQTKLFVTHGGTNGVQEAMSHGVPLLGLPLILDQEDNMFRMEVREVAQVLDIATVNREVFLQALKELLYQPKYRDNMKRLSALHRDQPMKPMDKAMFWIEFVMRHRGAKHLRTESYKLSTIQYFCIDVAVFLLTISALSLFVFMKILRVLWTVLTSRPKAKKE